MRITIQQLRRHWSFCSNFRTYSNLLFAMSHGPENAAHPRLHPIISISPVTFTAKCPPSLELSSQTVTTRLGPRATSNMADKEQTADGIEIKAKKPTDFHGFALYTFKARRYSPIDLNECLFSM